MAEQFQNFYVTKLREACDAVATTIYVDTVPAITEGTLVLEYANSTKHEIIHFTGVSGYGLTGCTRGMEGTTAQSHSAGVDVRQNLTAGMIDKIINGVITTENIANSAVTTAKINNGAVTADKIDFTTLKVWIPDYANEGADNLWYPSGGTAINEITVPETGFVRLYWTPWMHKQSGSHTTVNAAFRINGVDALYDYAEGVGDQNTIVSCVTGILAVKKGDKITRSTNAPANQQVNLGCKFIPGRWV